MKLRYAHSIAWQEYNDTIYIKNIETNEDFVVGLGGVNNEKVLLEV